MYCNQFLGHDFKKIILYKIGNYLEDVLYTFFEPLNLILKEYKIEDSNV